MRNEFHREPYTFDRVIRIIFGVCIVIAVLYLLNILKGVLLPFLVACLIAYLLEPIVQWNKRLIKSTSRILPVVLTLIEVTGILSVAITITTPYILDEMMQMGRLMQKYASSNIGTPFLPEAVHDFIKENLDLEYASSILTRQEWTSLIRKLLSSSWSFLSSGLSYILGLLSWLIVIVYVIFIMIDYERLMLSFRQLVPHKYRRKTFRIIDDVRESMNRYFRGQFKIAFIVGILFAIGFVIVGLPLGILLGLFIGMLNMVPYLQIVSFPITALLCIVYSVESGIEFWPIFWGCMAVYVIVQIIQDLYLTPKIMGKAMNLNPAIILLSLSIWGCLLGFMGLIIALPLTSLLLSYYNQYVISRYKDRQKRSKRHHPALPKGKAKAKFE